MYHRINSSPTPEHTKPEQQIVFEVNINVYTMLIVNYKKIKTVLKTTNVVKKYFR